MSVSRLTMPKAAALLLSVASPVLADVADRDWYNYQIAPSSTKDAGLQLLTDVDNKLALQLIDELGYFSRFVDGYIKPFADLARRVAPALAGSRIDPAGTGELDIVMLARRRDFTRLYRPSHFTAFTLPTLQKTTLVVGPLGRKASLREHLFHEYVHYRLRRDVPGGLPLWFEEGLATFLAKVSFEVINEQGSGPADAARHTSDESLRSRTLAYTIGQWIADSNEPYERLPLLIERRELQGLESDEVRKFYRTSHAFVRYLYLESGIAPQALARSLVLTDPGFPAGVELDFLAASRSVRLLFKGANFDLSRGQLRVHKALAPRISKASGAEVRHALAVSAVRMNPQAAAKLFSAIGAATPSQTRPWVGLSRALRLQGKTEAATNELAKAQAVAADDPHVLLEQAALASSGCMLQQLPRCIAGWQQAKTSLAAVLEAEPNNYEAIYRLGIAHLFSGDAASAQGYLEIAWQRVPWSARVNFFMGETMRLLGDSRARWYLTNARRWAGSSYFRKAASAALAALPDSVGSATD